MSAGSGLDRPSGVWLAAATGQYTAVCTCGSRAIAREMAGAGGKILDVL